MSSNKLSCAILARNSEETLADALLSIRPHCKELVVVLAGESTDRTEEIARLYADKVEHFEWCDDFSAAREFSFSLCTEDWILWMDSDDILQGGENIKGYLEKAPAHVIGFWLPYEYGHDEFGNVNTVFDRERIVRRKHGFHWQYRIHEVCKPDTPGPWVRPNDISIVHQMHDSEGSIKRNIEYLLVDLAKNPTDQRTLEYVGNQYFALGDYDAATVYWEEWQRIHNPDDTVRAWWVWLYMGRAYRELGDIERAIRCAMCALDCHPEFAEGYYNLGEAYAHNAEWEKSLIWTGKGRSCTARPPSWIFVNPLELNYRHHLFAEACYGNLNDARSALKEIHAALKVRPKDEVLLAKEEFYKVTMSRVTEREAWIRKARKQTPRQTVKKPPPDYLLTQPEVSIPYGIAMHSLRPVDRQRIIFFCGRSIEPWAPPKIEEGGIGGSETAVIEIAKRFRKMHYQVDVYGEPGKWVGVHNGVGYWPYQALDPAQPCDVFVSWRSSDAVEIAPRARLKILWLHDLNVGDRLTPALGEKYDIVAGVSEWHADYLAKAYPFLRNTVALPNGIDLQRFAGDYPKRDKHRCVYLSSPDRGLDVLLQLWPRFLAAQPDSSLHVYYGWQGIDSAIMNGARGAAEMKMGLTRLLDQPGVEWHGRVGQQELAEDLKKSSLWLYPAHFVETSCISAVEAMAAGVVPIVAGLGNLSDIVGDAGIVLPGNARQIRWQEKYIGLVLASLMSPEEREGFRLLGPKRAEEFTWDKAFVEWKAVVKEHRRAAVA